MRQICDRRVRSFTDHAVTVLAILATILVVAPLVAIFVYLIFKGASSLNLAFFTQVPKPVGEAGRRHGKCNCWIRNSAGYRQPDRRADWHRGGIFLAEFGRGTKLANAVRFTADVLNGVPSIVMGIAAYDSSSDSCSAPADTSPHFLAAWRWAS